MYLLMLIFFFMWKKKINTVFDSKVKVSQSCSLNFCFLIGGLLFGIFGKRSTRFGREPIVFLGMISHWICFILIFFNLPDESPLKAVQDNNILNVFHQPRWGGYRWSTVENVRLLKYGINSRFCSLVSRPWDSMITTGCCFVLASLSWLKQCKSY